MERKFRFETLDIWHLAINIANELFLIADQLEGRKLFRFAEQLRGAGMSISNNIAEGSGSDLDGEFKQFLRYARRSCFECANILIILEKQNLLSSEVRMKLYNLLDEESRKITTFMRRL